MSILLGIAALITAGGSAIALIIKTFSFSKCTRITCGCIECIRVPPVAPPEEVDPQSPRGVDEFPY